MYVRYAQRHDGRVEGVYESGAVHAEPGTMGRVAVRRFVQGRCAGVGDRRPAGIFPHRLHTMGAAIGLTEATQQFCKLDYGALDVVCGTVSTPLCVRLSTRALCVGLGYLPMCGTIHKSTYCIFQCHPLFVGR